MWSDGRISIGQCDLVESWDNLSLSQKKNLNYRYQMGCECRVSKGCSLSSHPYLSFVPRSKLSWDTTNNTEMILLCLSSPALAPNFILLRSNVNSLRVQRNTANTPWNPIIYNPAESKSGNTQRYERMNEWSKPRPPLSPQINTCYTVPCASTGDNECLWTDWLLDNSLNGEQARQYACIRRSDTTCSWYRGGPPPEKDFLDMTDPWSSF